MNLHFSMLLLLIESALAFTVLQKPVIQASCRQSLTCVSPITSSKMSGPSLFIASRAMQALEDEGHHHDPVTKVKRAINAIRATMRAATGVSLTAMYVSFVAFTSGLVRGTMSFILAWFPTWFRYFLQPFLILYYVPLYMLRTWTSPKKRKERLDLYTAIMDDVKRGVSAADSAIESGYWPLQLSENGVTAAFPPEIDDDTDTEAS